MDVSGVTDRAREERAILAKTKLIMEAELQVGGTHEPGRQAL